MFLDNMLGIELPLPVKLIVAFVVVLALIGLATWLVKRLGGRRLGVPSPRGRQPRLAVIDAAAVDGRRRLVLIRRDNVEHLIMIGGPTDVVVEQNILRAVPVAQPREAAPRSITEAAASEPLSPEGMRPMPSPETAPRVAQRFEPAARAGRGAEPQPRRPMTERPRGDLLSGLGRARSTEARPIGEPRPIRPQPMAVRSEPSPVEVHAAPPTADANLADMAHRLEEALRRPAPPQQGETSAAKPTDQATQGPESTGGGEPSDAPTAGKPVVGANGTPQPKPNSPATPPAEATSESKPAGTDPNPASQPQKSVFDSLEEEMASLLGRPTEKT